LYLTSPRPANLIRIRIKSSIGNAFYITVQMEVLLVSILHELLWLHALPSYPLLTHYWHINMGSNCLQIRRRLMRRKSFKTWGAINTCHGRKYYLIDKQMSKIETIRLVGECQIYAILWLHVEVRYHGVGPMTRK